MAYDQKDNSGALFRNERMREGKNDPSYNGSCVIDGKHYWISAWVKDGKAGKGKFFSFAFKPKEQSARKPDPGAYNPPPADDAPPIDDSRVPF